jgi:hypothetical protein
MDKRSKPLPMQSPPPEPQLRRVRANFSQNPPPQIQSYKLNVEQHGSQVSLRYMRTVKVSQFSWRNSMSQHKRLGSRLYDLDIEAY